MKRVFLRETQRRKQTEKTTGRHRDWSDMATNQGSPHSLKARRDKKPRFSPTEPPEGV
jgi:hypothetical protein